MLMDVSKEHRLQGPTGTQQLLKTCTNINSADGAGVTVVKLPR